MSTLLVLRCPFCNVIIESSFYDDLESHAMTCRKTALASKRGDLANYGGDTKPYTCEGEAFRQAQERSGRRGSGGGP